ncbi:MAG: RNA 2',3'-cyclic phosphodiesterase [Halobacteriota archaeon]|nr:RNA 2',3'-cyclic phosphodiesterase [Halobacteriota archaeon]
MGDLRAFVAVDIPDDLKEKIRKIQAEFNGFGLKMVDPKIVHLTLKFLGDVPKENIKKVSEALNCVNCEPFTSELRGVGVFPNFKRIRVVWIGAIGDFELLHDSVESLLEPLGFAREDKRFTSHITVARAKKITKDEERLVAGKVKDLTGITLGSMPVDRIKLKKSTLTPKGPIYEDLYVKELGG